MSTKRLILGLTLMVAFFAAPDRLAARGGSTKVKMATLVPDGSVWHRLLQEMKVDWKEQTEGRVNLVIYPGGVAGDEPDIVRKMRIGQLQAAAFTSTGLTIIDDHFKIFTIPMFFDSYAELHHVMRGLEPSLKQHLEGKGFVLLNWEVGGWLYFFSRVPVHSLDDLRKLKIFVWAGDERMLKFWKKNEFQPVALAATDIMTGLQTGMIDTLLTTPLASLSLQWFRMTPYMLKIGLAPLMGANIMTKESWDKIPAEDQARLLEVCRRTEERTFAQIPVQDARAMTEMEARKLKIILPAQDKLTAFNALAEAAASNFLENEVPRDMQEAALKLRAEYRNNAIRSGGGD